MRPLGGKFLRGFLFSKFFDSNQVRVLCDSIAGLVDQEDTVWFVAKDVAEALAYTNPQKAIRDHCKGVNESFIPTPGGRQRFKIINHRDVFRLIMKSHLPEAEQFEETTTNTPIRRTGR